jgi:CRISPR/Cas system-associated exonuclease Cas4 (RecB family)
MYDWKSRTIIDLKTTNFVDWQIRNNYLPRKEHILQLQCYSTMFSEVIPIENLCLLYIDMSNLCAYKINNVDRTLWITERIQKIENSLKIVTPPAAEVSGLCQFCNYKKICETDGNGYRKMVSEIY